MVTVCLIVAVAENGVIGRDGKMPWHIPAELKYFRARTLGKPVIMGRKTFQSIGKPLPGRDNIVVTRDALFAAEGVTIAQSIEAALTAARVAAAARGVSEIMVIGGSEIYKQAMPSAERIYLTRIAAAPDGDATFNDLNSTDWLLVEEQTIQPDSAEGVAAQACVYERRQ